MDTFGADEELSSDHHQIPTNGLSPPYFAPLSEPSALDSMAPQTEIYDAWQGRTQIIPAPLLTPGLGSKLVSDSTDISTLQILQDNDASMMDMLAEQATILKIASDTGDDQEFVKILSEQSLSHADKCRVIQLKFSAAASNGNTELLQRLLSPPVESYVNINLPDVDGSPALIYASCFGNIKIVEVLLVAGADVNVTDRNQWTPLMWALIGASNSHKSIAKLLLDYGADTAAKSSTGRSAADFVQQNREVGGYLNQSGYNLGDSVFGDGFQSLEKMEEESAERELMRKMMMESSINLEVDLGDFGSDLNAPSPDEDLGQDFVWDRCLNDQMFVFQEADLERILDIIITNMTPKRSPSQKPVPANILFLAARYAHYYIGSDLLDVLLVTAMEKINKIVDKHQWDMTVLAFWISNATLLLHYLRKDTSLSSGTTEFQVELADLINEIFVLIVRDAERRIDKVFDAALLQHETVPGLNDVTFQGEWTLFKRKTKPEESTAKWMRPPSPRQKAKTSPHTITSILSSTLFVLDLYDIHSVITTQVLGQLLYWIGTELFNRIMSNRRYLARTKAMQIRMNVASLEEWVQSNNRSPEHYEGGDMTAKGESTMESARRHFGPVIQLLQWLQCFSLMGDDLEGLISTLNQLPELNPNQLLHVTKRYRPEVGEPELPKSAAEYLEYLRKEMIDRFYKESEEKGRKVRRESIGSIKSTKSGRSMVSGKSRVITSSRSLSPSDAKYGNTVDEPVRPDRLLLDPSVMLPFNLPTPTDMIVRFGAGFGGMDRERERKYIPTVPPEFLARLDEGGESGSGGPPTVPPLGYQSHSDQHRDDDNERVDHADGDGDGGFGPGLEYQIPNGIDPGWDHHIVDAEVDEEVEKRDKEEEAERDERLGRSQSTRRWPFSLTG